MIESGDASDNPDEVALWKRLAVGPDAEARAQLIEHHLVTAQKIAAALYARRFDNSVEFADYLQYARLGLVEAIDRYDATREASFVTFATYRIRGAILNGIEKCTELATQRAQQRRLQRERLRSIKEDLPASKDPFARLIDLTLNLAVGYLLEESGIWKTGEADRASDPYLSFELKRLGQRMKVLLEALPERERTILRYHYFDHKEFVEISEVLGISKGRVSQLHARALQVLRDRYKEMDQYDKQF